MTRNSDVIVATLALGSEFDKLAKEAAQSRSFSFAQRESANKRDERGFLRTSRRFSVSSGGEVMASIHDSLIARWMVDVVDHRALPTRASFLYYASGDYVGPHHDLAQCTYTVLVPITQPSYLHTYPEGLDGEPDEIERAFLAGELLSKPVKLASKSASVITGQELMHSRPPGHAEAWTAVFCYSYA